MIYTQSNRGNAPTSEEPNGMRIQEAELQVFSDVDPYTKLTALFAVAQEDGAWGIEPEEIFVDTLHIPHLTLRAGKFKTAFGRHNVLHTHAYPFIDAPLINEVLLGEEGMNDVGVSAAALIPANWYSEVTFQVLSGHTPESTYFNDRYPNTQVYVAHFKNLWDLSEELTAEAGISGASGKNAVDDGANVNRGVTNFYGADLTFKWRPVVGGKYRALSWSTESINRHIGRHGSANQGSGYQSSLQYQFTERWWAQVRGEYLKVSDDDMVAPLDIAPHQRKYSALIGYFPSEFSGARLQYSYLADGGEDEEHRPEHKIYLQLNFTIGAHPAHSY
jgi:hypothetical protein